MESNTWIGDLILLSNAVAALAWLIYRQYKRQSQTNKEEKKDVD